MSGDDWDDLGANQNEDDPAGHTLFMDRGNEYYDIDAAIGFPIWVDESTLEFIFSIRYNSPAFNDSILQEDYRIMTHKTFSDLIKELIVQKLKMMDKRPDLYQNSSVKASGYNLNTINTKDIIAISESIGIDPGKIDVLTLVADVVQSLEKIVVNTIRRRPGMNSGEKMRSIKFMDGQLWDEDAQLRWRAVHAKTLATMYSYENLPRSVRIIDSLDTYINNEIRSGHISGDMSVTFMDSYLSDDVITYVLDQLECKDPGMADEMVIDNAIEDVRTGEWMDDDHW